MRLFVGILCVNLLIAGLVVLFGVYTDWDWMEILTRIGQGTGIAALTLGLAIGMVWGFSRE